MSLLYPEYLYGLLVLAIPVIIHLFNFRRTKKVYFSNSRFLKQVKDSRSARQRLKHLLIMTSRLLFLFFLITAFAQPYIPASKPSAQEGLVYIYLDNSLSMGNEVANNLPAFDQAIQNITQILSLYPRNTRFKLLTNDFSGPFRVFRSREEIQDMLTEIDQTGIPRKFEETWQRLNSQPSSAKADWYFLSDFQKSTFGGLQTFTGDSSQNYFFVPLVFNSTSNVFIDSVYLKNPFLVANDQNSIEIRLQNTGNQPVSDLVLTLAINDKQVANAGVDLPPNGNAITNINLNFPLEGNNPARLSFEEFPVSFDNDFYFNLNLSQRINILEIKNENGVTSVQKVYANPKLFDFDSYHINNLDYNTIDQADLVIINGLQKPTGSLLDRLVGFSRAGGHLLVIPHEDPDMISLNRLASFSGAVPNSDTVWVPLEAPAYQHPFFRNIFEDQSAQTVTMPRVLNTIKWNAQRGENYLMGKNGLPYLSSDYPGKVYLFATPLSAEYSSLPQHAVFVPVMYKIAALSKAFDKKLYYTTDEHIIRLKRDSVEGGELFSMSNGEEELIPDQRVIGQQVYLEVPSEVIKPGFYSINSPSGTFDIVSYNNLATESYLEQYTIEALSTMFPDDHITVMGPDSFNTYTQRILEANTGVPLWKYAIFLAITFLLLEVLLIRFLK